MQKVSKHVYLVLNDTSFRQQAPECFKYFEMSPTDAASLNILRNQLRLRHFIVGIFFWKSQKLDFQVELTNKKSKCMRKGEIYRVLLYFSLQKWIFSSTLVASSKNENYLETAIMNCFSHNIKYFNEIFCDTYWKIVHSEVSEA